MSDVVSSLSCVGRASAICLRILSVLKGLFAILMVVCGMNREDFDVGNVSEESFCGMRGSRGGASLLRLLWARIQ